MHTIKVWCLPIIREEDLKSLWDELLTAAKTVRDLEIESGRDVLILFPADSMEWELGTEVLIEVSLGSILNRQSREKLADALVRAVRKLCPDAKTVECQVPPFNALTAVKRSTNTE